MRNPETISPEEKDLLPVLLQAFKTGHRWVKSVLTLLAIRPLTPVDIQIVRYNLEHDHYDFSILYPKEITR